MIINCSSYLDNIIDDLELLVKELLEYFDDVSVLATDVIGKTISIGKNLCSIKDHELIERGFVVRGIKNKHMFEYSFNEFKSIQDTKETIINKYKNQELFIKKSLLSYFDTTTIPMDMAFETNTREVILGIDEISQQNIILKVQGLHEYGMSLSSYLVDFYVTFNYLMTSKVFISKTKRLKQSYMFSDIKATVLAKNNNDKYVTYHENVSGLVGLEIIPLFEDKIPEIINNTLDLFDAKKVTPGIYDIVCDPQLSGFLACMAIGRSVEADLFVQNRSKASAYIDKKVANTIVTIKDSVSSVKGVGSYFFDDEGNIGKETIIIENGILKAGISDYSSSLRLNTKYTGNGRRTSFEKKAYSRMTNIYFDSGDTDVQEMISSITYGYLLEGVVQGKENLKDWEIQCVVIKGREIIDGKFSGEIIAPVYLRSSVLALLENISMVGKELFLNAGTCVKAKNEPVAISLGGPYIKTKARLG